MVLPVLALGCGGEGVTSLAGTVFQKLRKSTVLTIVNPVRDPSPCRGFPGPKGVTLTMPTEASEKRAYNVRSARLSPWPDGTWLWRFTGGTGALRLDFLDPTAANVGHDLHPAAPRLTSASRPE